MSPLSDAGWFLLAIQIPSEMALTPAEWALQLELLARKLSEEDRLLLENVTLSDLLEAVYDTEEGGKGPVIAARGRDKYKGDKKL
jgi:hypothetical protein